MIPKTVQRFSEKIMLREQLEQCASMALSTTKPAKKTPAAKSGTTR